MVNKIIRPHLEFNKKKNKYVVVKVKEQLPDEILLMDKNYQALRALRIKKTKDYGGLKNYRYGMSGVFFDIARKKA